MKSVSMAEAEARLEEISDEVFRNHDRVRVTRGGDELVVIVAAAELESLEATIELLRDRAAMAEIEGAEQQIARGEYTTAKELRVLMNQRRPGSR